MIRLVFDADTWKKTGDVGDNSQFWKKATVVSTYANPDHKVDTLCDVVFLHDGRISKGHFFTATKPILKETSNDLSQ